MTMRSLKLGFLMAGLVLAPLAEGAAQGRARQGSERQGDRQGGMRQGGAGRMNREQMEERFRTRLANLLRTQLGLNDDQMRQLSDVNQRFDRQRRDMNRREMMTRRSLRDEVVKQDSADASRVDQLIAEQFKIERERIDLTEGEQRELAKFLTPMQRARYLGVQEQIRREMESIRGRGREGMGDPPQRNRRPPG
jgi:periplasmic protein CpxP/Spy